MRMIAMESASDATPDTDRRNPGAVYLELDRRRPLVRMDFSLNIPTMIALLGMVASTTVAGFTVYKDLSDRQNAASFAINSQAQRLDKVESAVNQLKLDQTTRNNELRSEIKSDIAEIKIMLNEVIFGRRVAPNHQLRDWKR